MKTNDARNLSPDAQEALRTCAVKAVCAGMRQNKAAQAFGVSEVILSRWMAAYRQQGWNGLKKKKRGPKESNAFLKGHQAATICNLIRERHPEQLRLPFALWTSGAIRDLVKRRFGLVLSRRSVRRYMRRWNFTPQKPKRVAYERSDVAVERWKRKQYPAIRALARKEKARIYWADEMGLRSDHQAGRSYSPKGVTPTRLGTGKRFSCNMISAITNRGDLAFMVYRKRFTAVVFTSFAARLIKEARGRKVFLIVDSHPVHRSRAVQQWVRAHEKGIRLYFLPSYSPELNPDECVNHDVKENAVGRRGARNVVEMVHHVRSYLRKRRKDRQQVKKYFHEPDVQYAA